MTDYIYLIPSFMAVIFLPSIAFYLLAKKPRKAYITVLSLFCLDVFLWNISIFLINLVGANSSYALPLAKIGAVGLIFIAPLIFHFIVSYTGYLETKVWYPLVYGPAFFLLPFLLNGYYVEGVAVRGFGIEPVYGPLLQANDMIAITLVIFSTFLIYRYYRESAGIKKYQSLYVLLAVPVSSILSFLSYEVLSVAMDTAQFPVGSSIDLGMALVLVYAILKFKLPVETAAEVDFRILAETASEGICIIDNSGRIDYANSHFSNMVGVAGKKVIGMEFRNFVVPDYHDAFRKAIKKTMKGNKITNLELSLRCSDGTLDVEINASPILWNEKIIGSFVTIRDVTERKKIQAELNRQKVYFQALFESSPEAIASLDKNHNVIDANPAFIKLFGYKLEEIKGRNLDDFILPDEREGEGRGITREVMDGKTVIMETVRKRKDGSLVPVSLLGAPIFVDGRQVGIFGIYRDIAEQKEAEEEKDFYNSLLRHDVANRNMVVQGNLEILDSVNLDPEQRSLVSNALSAARASTDLIKKVRELREAEGKVIISPMVIDEVILRAIKT
ncbi:MAG: PAS domain S-box protein, partial [Deltaproteobacteria bacterium]|nr:PAS domain S-box protein [Deltaproteobacteria bacterium]